MRFEFSLNAALMPLLLALQKAWGSSEYSITFLSFV